MTNSTLPSIHELFDLSHTLAREMLEGCKYPWEAVTHIESTVLALGPALDADRYSKIGDNIWAAKTARISPAAVIIGPCIIGENTELRPGAYIRGNALIGDGAVAGNSTELKNCILFDEVAVPHYNYVGDSILGYRAHLGAGAIISNVKGDRKNIVVHAETDYATGMRKLGAMIGDMAEIGCGCVINPGCIIGRSAQIYPLSFVRGVVPENSILKGVRGAFHKT